MTPKKSTKKEEEESTPTKKKKKEEEETPVYKWWLEPPLPKGKKWKTLSHNGVVFPKEYEPHGVKMLYDGKPVELNAEQEEVATFFAQYLESQHYEKKQFRENFFKEFLNVLNPKGGKKVKQTCMGNQ
jgi:DNA topoisomerase-1